eukprot:gene226-2377_t
MADTGDGKAAATAAAGDPGKKEPAKWSRSPIRVRPHRNPLADELDEHPCSPEQ